MYTEEDGLCCERHTHVVLKLLELVIYLFLSVCLFVCLFIYGEFGSGTRETLTFLNEA